MSARWRWLTPPGPAALSLLELEAIPEGLISQAVPPSGVVRLVSVRDPGGVLVDQAVLHGEAGSWQLSVHGGDGVRQALSVCLAAHGLVETDASWPGPGRLADPRWTALAEAASPAAARWLLQHDPEASPPFPAGFLTRNPWVLITGPANAGKSTLLNAWSGRPRALVSQRPGTTRDLVSAQVLVEGWRLTLVDSAGLRETDDALEEAGQELARAARQRADLVLYLAHPEQPCQARPGDLLVSGLADLRPQGAQEGLRWSALAPAAERSQLLARLGQAVLAGLRLPGEAS